MSYCFDTSAPINPWRKYYPIVSFPGFWDRIDQLIRRGDIIVPEDVVLELAKQEDDLYLWAKARDEMCYEMDDALQDALRRVMTEYGKLLVDARRDRSGADAVVIALASITNRTVVSDENPSPKPTKRLKIPDVCIRMNIRHIYIRELIREQKWTFR